MFLTKTESIYDKLLMNDPPIHNYTDEVELR
jgi:hypothetical protein